MVCTKPPPWTKVWPMQQPFYTSHQPLDGNVDHDGLLFKSNCTSCGQRITCLRHMCQHKREGWSKLWKWWPGLGVCLLKWKTMLLVQVILLLLLFKRKYSHLSCCNIINDPNIVPCKKQDWNHYLCSLFSCYTKHDYYILYSFITFGQNGLSGFQMEEVQKGRHHWIWSEQMEPFESIIYFSNLEKHNLEVMCRAWNMAQRQSTTLRT